MTTLIEKRAIKYLLSKYKNGRYSFHDKNSKACYDLLMHDKKKQKTFKIELKSTKGKYSKNSDIFQQLYFSKKDEVINFQKGRTKIIRIFLGNNPPKVFLLSNDILKNGAKFEREYRSKLNGTKNYEKIRCIS